MTPENRAEVKRVVLIAAARLAMFALMAWWIYDFSHKWEAASYYRQHPWVGVAVLAFAMFSAVMFGFVNPWLARTLPGWGVAGSAIALFTSVLASFVLVWSLDFFGNTLGLLPALLTAVVVALGSCAWWYLGPQLKSSRPEDADD